MADDLGTTTPQVHENAKAVLGFWFCLPSEKHFEKDASLDAEIASRFGAMRDAVVQAEAAGWRGEADTILAAIILLDQFSRNIHRGTAAAFAADPLAQSLTMAMIDRGWDLKLTADERVFAYMPLMHAEQTGVQALSMAKFTGLGLNLKYALAHQDVINRFGRFPSRNAALGRRSTPEEMAYLSQPDVGW